MVQTSIPCMLHQPLNAAHNVENAKRHMTPMNNLTNWEDQLDSNEGFDVEVIESHHAHSIGGA